MGSFWNKLFGKGRAISDSYRYEDNASAIERYVGRLSEIHYELEEIGSVFTNSANHIKLDDSQDPLEQTASSMNNLRVPGYCAYKLAEEGLILIHLLSVRMGTLENSEELSEAESQYASKLDGIVEYIDEAEEKFNLTLESMTPYKTGKTEDVITGIRKKLINDTS